MKIFNGKKIAEKILLDLKKRIKKGEIKLTIAVISIGQNPASKLFIRNKKQAAEELGVKVSHYKFKTTVKEEAIIGRIEKLNQDTSVNGIIVQLPLSKKFNTGKIISRVFPDKDIDGFGKMSAFPPVLPSAVLIDCGITVIGKKVFGDVDRKSVERKASFLTPVPGGIGPLTVALLFKNLYLAK